MSFHYSVTDCPSLYYISLVSADIRDDTHLSSSLILNQSAVNDIAAMINGQMVNIEIICSSWLITTTNITDIDESFNSLINIFENHSLIGGIGRIVIYMRKHRCDPSMSYPDITLQQSLIVDDNHIIFLENIMSKIKSPQIIIHAQNLNNREKIMALQICKNIINNNIHLINLEFRAQYYNMINEKCVIDIDSFFENLIIVPSIKYIKISDLVSIKMTLQQKNFYGSRCENTTNCLGLKIGIINNDREKTYFDFTRKKKYK